jgi:hypothetical protein
MTPTLWSSKLLLKVAPLGEAGELVVAGVVAAGGGGAAMVLDEALWIA